MNIKLKRAYEEADSSDGIRILVERLWPRGVTKQLLPWITGSRTSLQARN